MNILKRFIGLGVAIVWLFLIGIFMLTWPVSWILLGSKRVDRIEDWLSDVDNFPLIKWMGL